MLHLLQCVGHRNLELSNVTKRVMCRRYKPFLVAEADAEPGEAGIETAERLLQEYLAGSNDRQQPIDLTTPVFRDSACKVFCMLPGNQVRRASLLHTAMARCLYLP